MADDKRGRERQAKAEERRQREREIAEAIERGDEPEPPVEVADLAAFETELDDVSFPATAAEVVAAVGEYRLDTGTGSHAVEELLPDTTRDRFDSPAAVRVRVQRPSVAAAVKRVVEAADGLQDADFGASRREAYEKTFRALAAVTGDDEDEGIEVVADWIVEQIRAEAKLPESRAVRQRAATFCRRNGYEVRDDEWLGK
ncbi:hypothetical protein [Haloarcula litorea]|uniref:DUF5789 family protein n=1 Tax=Haloarcula litorea TaxID=3032579 RepID=UPI0023E866DD|nr:hypothetical protein [Halomicroarcula sp. GDY20]